MIDITLNGISFADLPHITNEGRDKFGVLVKGEPGEVVREAGEAWDCEARPAYSVRLGLSHVGYVPLVETISMEREKAREGWKKVWKEGVGELSKEELRAMAASGDDATFCDWKFLGTANTKHLIYPLTKRLEKVLAVREQLYIDYHQTRLMTPCRVCAVYFDEGGEGRNMKEQGEVCSVIATFPLHL